MASLFTKFIIKEISVIYNYRMLIKINFLQEARPEWVNIDTLSAKNVTVLSFPMEIIWMFWLSLHFQVNNK